MLTNKKIALFFLSIAIIINVSLFMIHIHNNSNTMFELPSAAVFVIYAYIIVKMPKNKVNPLLYLPAYGLLYISFFQVVSYLFSLNIIIEIIILIPIFVLMIYIILSVYRFYKRK